MFVRRSVVARIWSRSSYKNQMNSVLPRGKKEPTLYITQYTRYDRITMSKATIARTDTVSRTRRVCTPVHIKLYTRTRYT